MSFDYSARRFITERVKDKDDNVVGIGLENTDTDVVRPVDLVKG